MAIFTELGTKHPCSTQGEQIDVNDDELMISAGQIAEIWYEPEDPNAEIKPGDSLQFVQDILKMKEEYPLFVLHYVKVESRRITVQFSVAPMGAHGSVTLTVLLIVALIALAAILVPALYFKATRGYWLTPTGTATVTAKDYVTGLGLSGVNIYCDGDFIGTTDGSSVNTRQLVGEHIFSADPIEGYTDTPPSDVTQLIELNKNVIVTIALYPNGTTPPTTGFIDIYTTPQGAEIYVDTQLVGVSPIRVERPAPADYSVGFGDLEGYITPESRTVSVQRGIPTVVGVTYQTPEGWEKYLWYGLTAAAAIAAAAIIIPRVIKSLPRPIKPSDEKPA